MRTEMQHSKSSYDLRVYKRLLASFCQQLTPVDYYAGVSARTEDLE